jgi:hypothetical protein
MNVGLYAAQIQAEVVRRRESVEQAYEKFPDPTLYWCFVDLAESSNYRIVKGPRAGYVRGETFLGLVSSVVAPCTDVRIVKELGDGVLLASENFRPLFESSLLIDQTAHQLAAVAGDERFPFRVRTGLGYGMAKRLTRPHEDFLGSSIDQLARVMNVRDGCSDLLLQEEVVKVAGEILREYGECISVGEPRALDSELSKGMMRDIYYRPLMINRSLLVEFREHFMPWRDAMSRLGGDRPASLG